MRTRARTYWITRDQPAPLPGSIAKQFIRSACSTRPQGEFRRVQGDGLAPYGEPKYVRTILDNLIDLKPDGSDV
jgi:hypothetical protein